ncbi:MAG TPA: site-specific integrase [Actinomycetes bacterium]|nr:site-specific integrase [Actinomycetes bacterium]
MASIQKRARADGSVAYRVKFRFGGRMTSETFDDPSAAGEFGALVDKLGGEAAVRIRDARDDDTHVGPTLADWFSHHLDHSPGMTVGTRAEYRRVAARSWMPNLGHLPITAIDRDAVARWVARQAATLTARNTPIAAKTIANQHGLLSTVMASAVAAGHRPDNPCRGLPLPRGRSEEMVFLTHDEFAVLLSHIPAVWRPLIVTLAGTGMRWGEATALLWADVDLDAAKPTIRVVRAWKKGDGARVMGVPKTRRSVRTISLPPEVVDVLRPLQGRSGEYVFTGARGGTVHHQNFHTRVWRPAVGKLAGDRVVDGTMVRGDGKRPRIHDLRHSHASWLIAAGRPLPRIQRRLGHKSIQTTVDVYGHLTDDDDGGDALATSLALAQALPELQV